MLKKFLHYVSLNILGMVSIAFCIFADTFFIARNMGADGLTALNISLPIYSIVNGIGHMLGVGGGARYATFRASGRQKEADQVFTVAFLAGVLLAVIASVTGLFFAEPIARMLGASGHIVPMSTVYIRTVLTLAPSLILSNTLASFVRNDGAPRVAMISTMILAVFNVVLDWIFIFPLGLGMFGAALATMLGSTLGLIYLLWYWRSGKSQLRFHKFEKPLPAFLKIAITGMPSLIGDLSSAIVIVVFNLVILNLSGNLGVAVFGIVTNLSMVLLAIFNGIGQGMQPLVSTAYGEKNLQNQRQVLKYSLLTVFLLASVTYLLVFLFTDNLTYIFNYERDSQLRDLARTGVRIYFTGFFFVGVNIVTIIYLSVTNAPKSATVLSFLRGGLIIVPLVLLLSYFLEVNGVWLAYPLAEFIIMILALGMFRRLSRS